MIILKKERIYSCGFNNKVIIKDLGKIFIPDNYSVILENNTNIKVLIKKSIWGYSIFVNSFLDSFYKVIAGTQWCRAHYMVVDRKKKKEFSRYFDKEKHELYFSHNIKRNRKKRIYIPTIRLKKDQQYTFFDRNAHEYDVTSKEWGFYLTPSFGGRCKKFRLLPVLEKTKDNFNIKLVFKEYESFIHNKNFFSENPIILSYDSYITFKKLFIIK